MTIEADNQRPVLLADRLDLISHSPTGFEWGYGGSGPAQLALAILADCLNDDDRAARLHQPFKWQVVQHLPHEGWTLNETDVLNALQSIEREQNDGN